MAKYFSGGKKNHHHHKRPTPYGFNLPLLFFQWFKALSGVRQKHPLPGVFNLQFHLVMEVYFHLARMGKD